MSSDSVARRCLLWAILALLTDSWMRPEACRRRLETRGGAMGSRSRSIRLRIYFLVAIPLVALVGLLGYVAGPSVRNAVNLDRAPNLINATSIPTAVFTSYLQAERAAAVSRSEERRVGKECRSR